MLDFWEAGGKRALWVSVGNDLRLDAIRDLNDIRASKIKVYPEVRHLCQNRCPPLGDTATWSPAACRQPGLLAMPSNTLHMMYFK